jgi:hypothetical protein
MQNPANRRADFKKQDEMDNTSRMTGDRICIIVRVYIPEGR